MQNTKHKMILRILLACFIMITVFIFQGFQILEEEHESLLAEVHKEVADAEISDFPTIENPEEKAPLEEKALKEVLEIPLEEISVVENPPLETTEVVTGQPPIHPATTLSQHLNPYVLDIIKTYDISPGRYPYLLNNDYDNYNGVTTTLYYQNQLLLRAHPSGNRASHCSGITFEVFFKAMEARNRQLGISPHDFNGMTWDELYDFLLIWYAATGPKHESNISVAVEKYGIGTTISDFEDAQPGDFIDISRENNTGHTAVFLDWIREGNRIIGFKYWSSQDSTNGINYHREYFNILSPNGRKYGNVMMDRVYIARILPVAQYQSFR